MKKLILCAALTVGVVCAASAQDKIAFGVRAGVNINSLRYSGDSESLYNDLESRAGFHVGAVMDWNVAGSFYIQPGIYFTTRGAKGEWSESDEDYSYKLTEKLNMSYLQIPVLASYRFAVSDAVKIDVNVGPYIAFGLGGKVKIEETETYMGETERTSDKYDIFGKSTDDKDKGDFKRFDAGLRFGAGVNIHRFYVGVSYDLGLTNLAHTGDDYRWSSKDKFKNGALNISVGYNF